MLGYEERLLIYDENLRAASHLCSSMKRSRSYMMRGIETLGGEDWRSGSRRSGAALWRSGSMAERLYGGAEIKKIIIKIKK